MKDDFPNWFGNDFTIDEETQNIIRNGGWKDEEVSLIDFYSFERGGIRMKEELIGWKIAVAVEGTTIIVLSILLLLQKGGVI